MRTPLKLTAYAMGLVLIFGAAAGAGRVIGPDETPAAAPAHQAEADARAGSAAGGHAEAESGGHAETGAEAQAEAGAPAGIPGGLQVAEAGYRLTPISTSLPAQPFSFRVLGPDGRPVTHYTPTHEKNLHLIVVRRDLTGFRHLHPTMAADGTWSIALPVTGAGQYRVFADFQPAARTEGLTLGVDLPAPGAYAPRPLPPAAAVAEVDGYTVTLAGALTPGRSSKLTLTVTRAGRPVELEPYLGAYGHLVALREGDLAYLHVHAEGANTYYAEVPSAGAYRLYLDFQHGGTVRTAEFTAIAG